MYVCMCGCAHRRPYGKVQVMNSFLFLTRKYMRTRTNMLIHLHTHTHLNILNSFVDQPVAYICAVSLFSNKHRKNLTARACKRCSLTPSVGGVNYCNATLQGYFAIGQQKLWSSRPQILPTNLERNTTIFESNGGLFRQYRYLSLLHALMITLLFELSSINPWESLKMIRNPIISAGVYQSDAELVADSRKSLRVSVWWFVIQFLWMLNNLKLWNCCCLSWSVRVCIVVVFL